jgi:hypothetical protein
MNSLAWIGIIFWGLLLTGFGLSAAGVPAANPDLQPHDVVLLVAGGVLTCMIGMAGLAGLMGWVPLLRTEQKPGA